MFSHLFESVPPRRRMHNVPGASLSFALHALLLVGAIWATKKPPTPRVRPRRDIVLPPITEPARRRETKREPSLPLIAQVVLPAAPVVVLTLIPPVDSGLVVDTFTVLSSRIESIVALGPSLPEPDINSVINEAAVDERPEVIVGFRPVYPDLLRQAGIEGTVVVEAVLDTAGHAEPASVRVLHSTNSAFDNSAREAVLKTLYRPGKVRGEPVRVLVQVPITFAIRG